MNCFSIIHFGNDLKYLEYEIYTILMLKQNTKNDIIYLYSECDTPIDFVKIINDLNVITIGYNDDNITYNVDKFKSVYSHFNALRSCNYMFAFKLIKYEKICIIESDMIIMKNIDSIFELNCPSILYYHGKKGYINTNFKIDIKETKNDFLNLTVNKSYVNGGVLLIKPSIYYYNKMIKNIKLIIEKNCTYPNESLFMYTMRGIYNLPIKYNLSHYFIENFLEYKDEIIIYHFNNSIYKPLNIIKDNYIEKNKRKKFNREILLYFKKNYYDIYHKIILKKLNKLKNKLK
jgi:hypothetical protein